MTRHAAGWLLLALIGVAAGATSAAAQGGAFYKGKRLVVMVNYGSGGPADIEGRLFARHIGKHIEGHPAVIVQNIDGAGGLIGTTYLGEIAPKDGTMMGHLTGIGWRWAFDPERFRVDFKTYAFLGYQSSTAVYYVRTDVAPGIRTGADIMRAKGLISGGLGPDNAKDLAIRLGLELLGIPHRHVTSYRSSAHARLALQQGEINFFSESPPSYRGVVHPGIVKDGLAIPVWHDPETENGKLVGSKHVADLDIPPYHEFFRAMTGRAPDGPLWDALQAVRAIGGSMIRILALPPGAPPAAVDALQTALVRLDSDADYAADARKVIGYVPQYTTGPNTGREVRETLTISPQLRSFVLDYVKTANR